MALSTNRPPSPSVRPTMVVVGAGGTYHLCLCPRRSSNHALIESETFQGSRKRPRVDSFDAAVPRRSATTRTRASSCIQTRQRNMSCRITGATHCTIPAHIMPSGYTHAIYNFLTTLETFWTEAEVECWKASVDVNEILAEFAENHVLMSPDARSFWASHYSALNPVSVSHDKKELTLRFYWLSPSGIQAL